MSEKNFRTEQDDDEVNESSLQPSNSVIETLKLNNQKLRRKLDYCKKTLKKMKTTLENDEESFSNNFFDVCDKAFDPAVSSILKRHVFINVFAKSRSIPFEDCVKKFSIRMYQNNVEIYNYFLKVFPEMPQIDSLYIWIVEYRERGELVADTG